MEYRTKIKIAGVEIMDSISVAKGAPFIAGVKVKDSTALSAMEIGATASDCLYFSLYNPFKTSFDGETVELFISPIGDSSEVDLDEIAESVGTTEIDEAIDEDESIAMEDDSEDGEEMTAEELAEAEQTEAENIEATYDFFNGENDTITPVETAEGIEEKWVKTKTFHVFNQTNSAKDNSIMFECLDGFSLLNDKFNPTVTQTTVQALYEDYRTQVRENYGIEVDEFSFADPYNQIINWNIDCTYREAIGYFAGIVGGFATFDADDSLGISFYSFNDTVILSESLIDYKETSAGEVFIESLTCNRSNTPYKEDVIESGYGQGLTFSNPFVTQEMLDDITAYYKGIRYVGAELSMFWNETIQSGEFIRIMTRKEYANYIGLNNALERASGTKELLRIKDALNSLGKVILISNQTINFTGNAISKIDSICDTEFKKANQIPSPSDGYFKALYAEMIEAEYLKAKGAYIADLTTENLKVESINGKAIKNSAVLAKALSQSMVETVLGVNVFYSSDPPEAENVGDIWYVTIADQAYNPKTDVIKTWNGSEWVQQEFSTPNSIFMANSIVAQDINANEITANKAFMDLLQARLVRVGQEDEGHIEIDENSVKIVNGNQVIGTFGGNGYKTMTIQSGTDIAINARSILSVTDGNGNPQPYSYWAGIMHLGGYEFAIGTTTVVYPVTVNYMEEGSPAMLDVKGDINFNTPHRFGTTSGSFTIGPLTIVWARQTIAAKNGSASFSVLWPRTFAAAPMVMTSAETAVSDVRTRAYDVTASGFTFDFRRNDTTNTAVCWLAIGPTYGYE